MGRDDQNKAVIWLNLKANYFLRGVWTAQISLRLQRNFAVRRRRFRGQTGLREAGFEWNRARRALKSPIFATNRLNLSGHSFDIPDRGFADAKARHTAT
jgi:hypothetical protein